MTVSEKKRYFEQNKFLVSNCSTHRDFFLVPKIFILEITHFLCDMSES